MAEAKKSTTVKKTVFLEHNGQQYEMSKIMEQAVEDYTQKHSEKLNSIKLYVKPEDKKAYYSANDGTDCGNVDL